MLDHVILTLFIDIDEIPSVSTPTGGLIKR